MTLQGLSTIRTSGKQDIALSQLFTYQNQHTQVNAVFNIKIEFVSHCTHTHCIH